MKIFLLNVGVSFLSGFAAAVAWFMALVVGTGESGTFMVYILYASGIFFAVFTGFLSGLLRSTSINLPSILVGWLFALPFTPMTLALSNPANKGSDKAQLILLLALFFVAGVLCAVIGARWRRRANSTLNH